MKRPLREARFSEDPPRPALPYFVATLLTGSLAVLAHLVQRELDARRAGTAPGSAH